MKNKNIYRFLFVVLLALLPLSGMCRSISGDVNHDGRIDINDVTLLIHYELTGDSSMVDVVACNVDKDNVVDIADISKLIGMVLTGNYFCPPAELTIPEGSVTYTVNGVSFQMVPVEGGTFMMGGTSMNNTPKHEVTLSNYWIGLTEVTVGLWRAVMGSYVHDNVVKDDDLPAVDMSWYTSQEFIARLNELTGMNFHLATEAQWEFAARGGNLSHGYPFAGSNYLSEVAWFRRSYPYLDYGYAWMFPVGTKAPNELGLYDMCGSVYELIADACERYPSEPQFDPLYEDDSEPYTVIRGGGYYTDSVYCAVNSRFYYHKDENRTDMGLRLALGPN